MDYHTIRASVELIVGVHIFLLDAFENSLRDTLSSDIQALLSNNISQSTIQNSIRSALIHISSLALEEFEKSKNQDFKLISGQLWNPLLSAFSSLSLNDAPPRGVDQGTKKVPNKVKPSTKPIDHESVDVARVRQRLQAVISTKPVLYRNVAHKHIKCETTQCAFCLELFQRVNITRCDGHKQCHSTGYYPHVGTALWSMVKTRHNKKQSCLLPEKLCEPHELPALLNSFPVSHDNEQDSVLDDESRDVVTNLTPRKRPSSRMSTQSEDNFSWSEDVEDMIRKRRPASCPPSNSN